MTTFAVIGKNWRSSRHLGCSFCAVIDWLLDDPAQGQIGEDLSLSHGLAYRGGSFANDSALDNINGVIFLRNRNTSRPLTRYMAVATPSNNYKYNCTDIPECQIETLRQALETSNKLVRRGPAIARQLRYDITLLKVIHCGCRKITYILPEDEYAALS